MSQVILREEEMKGLKAENQKLDEIVKKKEEENIFFKDKNMELLKKNEKMAERVLM